LQAEQVEDFESELGSPPLGELEVLEEGEVPRCGFIPKGIARRVSRILGITRAVLARVGGEFVYGVSLIAQTKTYKKDMTVRTGRFPGHPGSWLLTKSQNASQNT
jgi:hypothetical protein